MFEFKLKISTEASLRVQTAIWLMPFLKECLKVYAIITRGMCQ